MPWRRSGWSYRLNNRPWRKRWLRVTLKSKKNLSKRRRRQRDRRCSVDCAHRPGWKTSASHSSKLPSRRSRKFRLLQRPQQTPQLLLAL